MYVRAYVHIKRHIICICACRRVRIYIHMTSVHAYLPAYLHTYLPTYLPAYIHTDIQGKPKHKNNILWETVPSKDVFFWFSLEKVGSGRCSQEQDGFGPENQLFPRKHTNNNLL